LFSFKIKGMKREKLALNKIFLKDERFRISYYFDLDKLTTSIKEVGLLNPPLVTLRERRYILVSGWKRVTACLSLSLSPIPVLVVQGKSELEAFLQAFYENLAIREFTLLEKAEIIARLKKFGEDEKRIVRHYLPLLDIPPTLSHLDSHLAFSRFEPGLKKFIYKKNLSFSLVKLFSEFSISERKGFRPLVSPLSQNKMTELLESLMEISKRDELPVRKILGSKEVKEILDSRRLFPLQKADKVRLVLRKKRYPNLSSWEESFDALRKEMRWPREITLSPTPYFEEKKLSVAFNFENQEEFNARLFKLGELASKKEFSEFFKLK
jgi:ParB family chromosome partitioning protein